MTSWVLIGKEDGQLVRPAAWWDGNVDMTYEVLTSQRWLEEQRKGTDFGPVIYVPVATYDVLVPDGKGAQP